MPPLYKPPTLIAPPQPQRQPLVYTPPDPCAEPNRSRPYEGGPYIEWVTVNATAVSNVVMWDFQITLTRAYRLLFIGSINNAFKASNIWFHMQPLGLPIANVGNTITELGTEQWIPFSNSALSVARAECRYIKFSEGRGAKQFYLDADHPNGAGTTYAFTLGATNDIEYFTGERT